MDERKALILLNLVPELGPVRVAALAARFGSAAAALDAPVEEWGGEGWDAARAAKLRRSRDAAAARLEDELERATKAGARALIRTDEDYPESLKSLPDAPPVLYVKGSLKPADALAVALVGTRRATPYGRAAAEHLARGLAQAGITVVSGLARGIDTAAHEAALQGGGRTVGVLGGGLDEFYPPENKRLAERMAAQGAVVSEFPMSARPAPQNFPRRNRVISGMSLAVVVAEADVPSGALITAKLAAEQGRDVLAVPGSIFSRLSRGPHALIKDGARPVEKVEDVLEEIEALKALAKRRRPAPPARTQALPPVEARVLDSVTLDPAGVDALALRSGVPGPAVSAALLGLELKGLVRIMPGGAYVRAEPALS
jgi:DNA processing protein